MRQILLSIATVAIALFSSSTEAFGKERPILVTSLAELAHYTAQDGCNVKLKAGHYKMSEYLNADSIERRVARKERTYFNFSGNNNVIDMSGVKIEIDTKLRSLLKHVIHTSEIVVSGNNNNIKGFEVRYVGNTLSNGGCAFTVNGEGNTLEKLTLYVQGSAPYGYGDLFGKGRDYVVRHQKHSGFLINGSHTNVIGCKLYMRSYGHGYFIQNDASYITFTDCYVEGEVRLTDDILAETSGIAYDAKFRTWTPNRDGEFIVTGGYGKSLCEDGFRTYNANNKKITFINCTAKNTRGGFELRTKGGVYLEGCTTIGTERGYWVNDGAIVKSCKGDASYGPLLFVEGSKCDVELQVVSTENDCTVHALATIQGDSNKVKLSPYKGKNKSTSLPILVGYTHPEHGESMSPYSLAICSNLELTNDTTMPVLASDLCSNCSIATSGKILIE